MQSTQVESHFQKATEGHGILGGLYCSAKLEFVQSFCFVRKGDDLVPVKFWPHWNHPQSGQNPAPQIVVQMTSWCESVGPRRKIWQAQLNVSYSYSPSSEVDIPCKS